MKNAVKVLVACVAVMFACTAWATYFTETVDGIEWTYQIVGGNAEIANGSSSAIPVGTSGAITVPKKLGGKNVTTINNYAFAECNQLTKVTIQSGVTKIYKYAFSNCTSLKEVDIPAGVTTIGQCAFFGCSSLEDVKLPDEVTSIEASAFYNCSALESIEFPVGLKEIRTNAFKGCTSLKRVVLPDGIINLGSYAFERCESLVYVYLPEFIYRTDAKTLYFEYCPSDLVIASAQTVGGLEWHFKSVNGAAEICYDSENDESTIPDTTPGAVVIPSTIWGLPVTSIGEEAFYGCDQLTSVTIPATVTSIGDSAFERCSGLTSVTIPETVTDIGDMAFLGCDGMADANGFVIVRGVLHHYAGSAKEVAIPEGVTRIGSEAFYNNNKLTAVTFPAGLTSIGVKAFYGCMNLKDVAIPESVPDTGIGEMAFYGCMGLADEDGFVVVRNYLHYYGGDQGDVTVPEGVAVVGRMSFSYEMIDNTKLKSVRLPVSVTSISAGAFFRCTALTEMYIPKSVSVIMRDAFGNTALNTVHVEPGYTDAVKSLIYKSRYADYASITYVEDLPPTREVVFYADGGSVSPASKFVSDGMPVGTLPTPTLAGYTFDGWFTASGEPVTAATLVTADVIYYASWMKISTLPWFTTRAEALAEAKKTGKTVFMICGRDSCSNTMMTKNVSCEDPIVKDLLTAKCVLWYTNCDTQKDDNYRYWGGMGTGAILPFVGAIDPKDPEYTIFCISGPRDAAGILALLQLIPEPVAPGGSGSGSSATVDPESIDPFNPGKLPCYDVLNPADIWDPIRAPKAVTLMGAAYYGCDVVGIVELKVGKLNKNRQAKVSGTVTWLDGTKFKLKSKKYVFGEQYAATLSLGDMRIAIGSIGGANVFSGEFGKFHVQTAKVGTGWGKSTATVNVDVKNLDSLPSGILEALLPTNEVATAAGGKWSFKKAASVKWTKVKGGMAPLVQDAASGKGLVVDTSGGKTNLSGLKLTYTPKKGTFKGSFKLYELKGEGKSTKLKKYTVNVNGVVVDGVGYGKATSKKPAFTWSVMVK